MKKICAVCTCILVLLSLAVPAAAADRAVAWGRTGSISITLKDSGEPSQILSGAVFRLFQVGAAVSADGALAFQPTDAFAASPVSLKDLSAEGLAEQLAAYAEKAGLLGLSAVTDTSGCAVFAGLPLGLYLVVQSGSVPGYYGTLPFLISLPMGSADGTSWLYAVEAGPKVERRPDIPSVPDGPTESTPPLQSEPTLPPDAPEEPTTPSGKPVGPTLIQTGQLNWPVPVLASVGMALTLVGWTRIRRGR